ncbi:MAG TPA: hypothetical protein VF131_28705 [Blastocatellia bacterium]|nr:hypothetical protein [Blastocatellia bacterium]
MGKRKRIGYGALDWIDNRNSQIWLQDKFLKTIEKLEPKKERKPLGDLAERPFEDFARFRDKQDRKSKLRRQQVFERLEKQSGRLSFFSLFGEDDPLRKAIWQWGETYHLNSEWCYEVALLSLQNWHQFNDRAGKRFTPPPFYGHPNYLGFGSLVMVHNLASMRRDSLNERQKALVDSFSEQEKRFVESFNERQRAFLSSYSLDPHIQSDAFSLNQMEGLIDAGLSLPVFNLLGSQEFKNLRDTLFERATELLERVNETAKKNSSVKPMEVGADEVNKHLEWAVRYQVFEESYYSIEGNKYGHRRDKLRAYARVRKGVLRILELVDLKPRAAIR